jgi:hypothetical protein
LIIRADIKRILKDKVDQVDVQEPCDLPGPEATILVHKNIGPERVTNEEHRWKVKNIKVGRHRQRPGNRCSTGNQDPGPGNHQKKTSQKHQPAFPQTDQFRIVRFFSVRGIIGALHGPNVSDIHISGQ